jgi:hypothetical protein
MPASTSRYGKPLLDISAVVDDFWLQHEVRRSVQSSLAVVQVTAVLDLRSAHQAPCRSPTLQPDS